MNDVFLESILREIDESETIFIESSEVLGLRYQQYRKIPNIINGFLEKISAYVQQLKTSPETNMEGIGDVIQNFKSDIIVDDKTEPIDPTKVRGTRNFLKKMKNEADTILTKLSKLRNQVHFGGNLVRGILLKPNVYSRDIDDDAYGNISNNMRAVHRSLDWTEKVLIDLFNLIDQDLNILTIVNRQYLKRKIYENVEEVPPIIDKVGFDFDWNEEDIWKLDIPITSMRIEELTWHFDIPFWDRNNGDYNLRPIDVINNMGKYKDHGSRIKNADTSYPLDILKNPKTNKWTLLDGLHRLAKLYMEGKKVVKVRKVTMADINRLYMKESRDVESFDDELSRVISESTMGLDGKGFNIVEFLDLEHEHMFLEFNDPPYSNSATYHGFRPPPGLYELNETYKMLLEKGDLKYTYRLGFDVRTGTKVAVEFELDPEKITDVGDRNITTPAAVNQNPRYSQEKDMNSVVDKIHSDALEPTRRSIKRFGHLDHITSGLKVRAIFDINGNGYQSVTLLPAFSVAAREIIREIILRENSKGNKLNGSSRLHQFFQTNDFKSSFIRLSGNPRYSGNLESYHISKDGNDLQGDGKHKTTKLFWNYDNFSTFMYTPKFRGTITANTRNKDHDNSDSRIKLMDDYNIMNKPRKGSLGESMEDDFNSDDDLDWIESYLMEEGEDPPELDVPTEEAPVEEEQNELTSSDEEENIEDEPIEEPVTQEPISEPPEIEPKSLPKQTDAAESDKNGVRRKKLYIAFIEWCKEYNPKNTFGSVFDKDIFHNTYPFVPNEMRYFYRLANPMLCVLGGELTFFAVAELRKVNANTKLDEMMVFAATQEDLRVFSKKDKKIYRAVEENGILKLNLLLGDTFDQYIQKMIDQGEILNGPIESDDGGV